MLPLAVPIPRHPVPVLFLDPSRSTRTDPSSVHRAARERPQSNLNLIHLKSTAENRANTLHRRANSTTTSRTMKSTKRTRNMKRMTKMTMTTRTRTTPRTMIRMRSLQPSPVQALVPTVVVIVEPHRTGRLPTAMDSSIGIV